MEKTYMETTGMIQKAGWISGEGNGISGPPSEDEECHG